MKPLAQNLVQWPMQQFKRNNLEARSAAWKYLNN